MAGFKEKSFAERRVLAENAKAELLKRYKSGVESPEFKEREAARKAVLEARRIRNAEREAIRLQKEAEEARIRAEQEAIREAERLAKEQAAKEAKAAEAIEASARASRVIADEIARKAARDAKYAARKQRQAGR